MDRAPEFRTRSSIVIGLDGEDSIVVVVVVVVVVFEEKLVVETVVVVVEEEDVVVEEIFDEIFVVVDEDVEVDDSQSYMSTSESSSLLAKTIESGSPNLGMSFPTLLTRSGPD